YLSSIEDLVSALTGKAETSDNIPGNSRVYYLQIYLKDAIRGIRIRAKASSEIHHGIHVKGYSKDKGGSAKSNRSVSQYLSCTLTLD
ncbi:hypothetical protein BB560_004723, partial [Smittium megazygosporum]